jgi:Arc/MetJ-type ribon-helix-helix transcriptional regulator
MSRETKETIPVRLPKQALDMIELLVPTGLYGTNRGEVARSLILDQLKRIKADGLLDEKAKN